MLSLEVKKILSPLWQQKFHYPACSGPTIIPLLILFVPFLVTTITHIHQKVHTIYIKSQKIYICEVCPENIQPFWISREPVASPWFTLAASQRRPYWASKNYSGVLRRLRDEVRRNRPQP